MLHTHEYPILEFDDAPVAKLNPEVFAGEKLSAHKLVITFFPEVIDALKASGEIELERVISGENPVYLYHFADRKDILITLGYIGAAACGGNLDLFHAMGVNKVMFCGGGGVLDGTIQVGQLLVVDGAIRDEGFSYHYVAPSRVIYTDTAVTERIVRYLEAQDISHLRGLVWTTDAIFRETEAKIERRRAEGARIVEMEQAGCIAVAQARGFDYGALIYGGDDVSQSEWSERGWRSRKGIRHDLVMLCKRLLDEI
ncbi:MAG: nucleoside phosphorylase [Clostridia bacterium]|nr:nucleoside phosphorylase [Clostridia bacterium]